MKTKLLYITNGINGSGGLERVLSIKASWFAEKLDYEVHILVLNDAHQNLFYEFSPKIHLHSIKVNGNAIIYFIKYATQLRRKVKQINPNIILVCDDGFKAFLLPIILQKPCKMIYERHVSKNISITHNDSILKKIQTYFQFSLMNFLGNTYDKFIVLTPQNKKEWRVKNLCVIPNPISFYPEKIAALQNKKVLAVGKQSYQKGYDLLLLAWQKVIQKNPDWKLEVYGKKDKNQNLEQLAQKLGIEKTVNFFEPTKNIQEQYLQSSIYVMSSRYEGFGMVLIEAMACGVPCVSFDCPYGPSDIIENGKDGFVVENGNINQLEKRITQLMQDELLRKHFGKNARQNVTRYLTENVVEQWQDLFEQLEK